MAGVSVDPSIGIDVLPMRFRKATKQLATLGPASSTFEMIEKLFLSGQFAYFTLFTSYYSLLNASLRSISICNTHD